MSIRRHVMAALTLAGITAWTAGCIGDAEIRGDCSTGVAVLWSSETAFPSWVEIWTTGGRQAKIRADVQGIHKVAEFSGATPSPWFSTTGNTVHDKSSIGRLNRSDCSVQITQLKETAPFDFADVAGHPAVSIPPGDRQHRGRCLLPRGHPAGQLPHRQCRAIAAGCLRKRPAGLHHHHDQRRHPTPRPRRVTDH